MHATRLVGRLALVVLVVCSLLAAARPVAAANGVVGTGSAASCSEGAFNNTLAAVQNSGGGTITFNCGAAPVNILFSNQKEISSNVVLNGGGKVSLSGQNLTGLFQVFFGHTLTLNNITLTRAAGSSGAVENFGTLVVANSTLSNNASTQSGGAILNYGTLSVTGSVITGNSADLYGGGIYSESSTATVASSQVTNNSAVSGGGGIAAAGTASLSITGSTFTGNMATDTFAQGGALYSGDTAATQVSGSTFTGNNSSRGGALSLMSGSLNISGSVINGNWAAYGGGIRQEGGNLVVSRVKLSGNGYAPNGTKVSTGGGALSWGNGTATLTNVSIINNWASYGGGMDHIAGTVTLTNVTIDGNLAVGSGGIDHGGGTVNLVNVTMTGNSAQFFAGGLAFRGGTLTLKNTLFAGNFNSSSLAAWNCDKLLGSTPFNLSSDFTCGLGPGRDGVNLKLSPLKTVDAYTQVRLPLQGSPAVDSATAIGCPPNDQRLVNRPQGAACDQGAVEVAPTDPVIPFYVPLVQR